ncbi:MAG TPA: SLC13 family permease [Kofleriaceae bacterium]|nr:SLC13 family permease [Kofleriaceae bacterium]
MEIALALGIVVVAITLLSIDRIPLEVSSLTIVVLLALSGLVTPTEALAGFSSETAIFIFALLAMTQGLAATGVMQIAGRRLIGLTRLRARWFVLLLLCVVAAFSSMASNTAVTAAFLPVATSASLQVGMSPRRVLMPMAFASMLGGTIFLFGTSTNLVISGAMDSMGLGRIGFAELTPLGLPLTLAGIATMYVAVDRLLVRRSDEGEQETPAHREYVAEAIVMPGSRFIGHSVQELADELAVPVHSLMRDGKAITGVAGERIRANDIIVISGSFDDMLRIKDLRSISLRADLRLVQAAGTPMMAVEVAVPPTSTLEGRSLGEVRFADRYGLVVVAIHRHPTLQRIQPDLDLLDSMTAGEELKTLRLSVGDMLLVRGPEDRIRELHRDGDLTVLSGVEYEKPRYERAGLALAIFAVTVIVAGLRLISPAIAGLAGLLVMVATRCVGARTAFRVDWRVVIMIGALLTLGLGMERSGSGEYVAERIFPLATTIGPYGMLLVQMILTIVLSIPMSNQAAALIMLPIGVHTAMELGLNPRTFAIATCLAASCSFVTPFEPAAALVYGAGRYRVTDFLRAGAPVTLVCIVILAIGVPMVWPFSG